MFLFTNQSKWRGIIHHVCGVHEWVAPVYPGEKTWCAHGDLEEREDAKEPLIAGSQAHIMLCKIVLDETFLKNVPHYLNLRRVILLETTHN